MGQTATNEKIVLADSKPVLFPIDADGGKLLHRLWRDYLSTYWKRLALALVAMVVLALTISIIPFVIEAINAAILPSLPRQQNRFDTDIDALFHLAPFLLPAIGLIYAAAQYSQSRLSLGAGLNALRDIQRDLFDHFLKLDLAGQRQELAGVLASRFTNDIQILREMLTRVTNGVRDLFQLIGLCMVMLFYDALLFGGILVVYALVGGPIGWLGQKLRRNARIAQEQTGDLAAAIVETAQGSSMIKTYGLENQERRRFGRLFDARTRSLKIAAYLRAANEPLVFLVGTIAIALVVVIIGLRIQGGDLDAPSVAGFIVALLLLSQPARGLSTLYAVVQEGLAAFGRIVSVLNTNTVNTDIQGRLEVSDGAIVFQDVGFDYASSASRSDVPVLSDINLQIESGKTVALVGESGAGKTTLLNLLPRLFDTKSGQILIDGQDIQTVSLASLRKTIALVSQDAVLFRDTIGQNIAYGREAAGQAEIEIAAKNAAAHDFIMAMPDGYQTLVGEAGNTLSGGQRQRIAIARAFLKNAPILLLDEPTAALDAESEAAIQAALTRLTEGRTTLIIAHRLSTIRHADEIIVMDKGKIVEQGQHDDLISRDGAYARLVKLQFG